ncbi:hypothetical protein SKAU_G00125260 [Synaphobranchus kaupii]|uniref:Uncharacterized protein n=1 Tax=Synaphobranchus kaupii TaxID=118154 RepID=A0A9Q1J2X3_SYNKA|nr:hypothetical protein SKAU_G00125260 [Synaphobranchus kaupii]
MRKTSRYHMLCSMANSGCLLLSGSGMLPHSLQCPPAFLYLPEQFSHLSTPESGVEEERVEEERGGPARRCSSLPCGGPAPAPAPRSRREDPPLSAARAAEWTARSRVPCEQTARSS